MICLFDMDLFGLYMSDDEVIDEKVKCIEGLEYYKRFISPEEERELLNSIDNSNWLTDLKRKVQHYGFKYDYRARKIDESFRIGKLPFWSELIVERMQEKKIIDFAPDQLIINNYEIGEGISMHVDCEPCFTDTIISLSLFSDIVMDFKRLNSNQKDNILLQRGSLLVISGDARYKYEHGIAQRKRDLFNERKRDRQRRISLTFRKVILKE